MERADLGVVLNDDRVLEEVSSLELGSVLRRNVEFAEDFADFFESSQEFPLQVHLVSAMLILLAQLCILVNDRILPVPVSEERTLHLVDILCRLHDVAVSFNVNMADKTLRFGWVHWNYAIACTVPLQPELIHLRVVSCLPHSNEPRNVDRDLLLLVHLAGFSHPRCVDALYFLFQGEGSVSRHSKCLDELVGLGVDDSLDAIFFLDPGFHEEEFPGLVDGESPGRSLVDALDWDDVIHGLNIVLSVSPHKVLEIAFFGDGGVEEDRPQVLFIDHAELRHERRVVRLVLDV